MTNEEAAKKIVELYGLCSSSDADGEYAEAVARATAALIYTKEVKPNVNTNWSGGSNVR